MRQLLQPVTSFVYCNRQAPPAAGQTTEILRRQQTPA